MCHGFPSPIRSVGGDYLRIDLAPGPAGTVGPLPSGCRIELVRAGVVVHSWDVDALRVFVAEPADWVPVNDDETWLRASGLARDDIVWVVSEEHVIGYNGMWAKPGDDARVQGNPVGELATIREYLSNYRLTLGMKCDDLSPEQLATRSVPPSTMSLLGLIRHMARVEHNWFVRSLQGQSQVDRLFWSEEDNDLDFNGAVGDPAVVREAFAAWKEQIAGADAWLDGQIDLGAMAVLPRGDGQASVRDILIHMIEEYARHCGHADLLRECVDGRTGQ